MHLRLLFLLLLLSPAPMWAQSGIRCTAPASLEQVQARLKLTRTALLERAHEDARQHLQVALELLPCAGEPVPARVLARAWFYDAFLLYLKGSPSEAHLQLKRALALSSALEWDDALGDPQHYGPFTDMLEDIRVQRAREASARVQVKRTDVDRTLYVDGTPWSHSPAPQPLTAGRHLVQRQTRQTTWEAAWLDVLPGSDMTIADNLFQLPKGSPPEEVRDTSSRTPMARNPIWLGGGFGAVYAPLADASDVPEELRMPALWVTYEQQTRSSLRLTVSLGISPADRASAYAVTDDEPPVFFRLAIAGGWPLGNEHMTLGPRFATSYFRADWEGTRDEGRVSVLPPEVGLELTASAHRGTGAQALRWRLSTSVGLGWYHPLLVEGTGTLFLALGTTLHAGFR